MPEGERKPEVDEEVQRAAHILRSLQNCDRFEVDPKDPSQIRLLYNIEGDTLHVTPSGPRIKVKDFLKAVDYYYENRVSDTMVGLAMTKPDGVVNVYTPHRSNNEEGQVVVSIKNYMVPQILEFAYLLVRRNKKST